MLHEKKQGFTLVELIIVISILAILGTISFITMQGFARDSRNSARTSDAATIRSGLSFFSTQNGYFPAPDNAEDISHSGAILWKQGSFGEGALRELGKISKNIVDPQLNTPIDYGVLQTRSDYQISTIYEVASVRVPGVTHAYAASSDNFVSRIDGTYDSYDLNAKIGTDCNLITIPSLLLSEIPSGGSLLVGESYEFSYDESQNLPKNVYGAMDTTSPGRGFQIEKVYDECSVDDIADIDLYIAQVSTAYQQYADSDAFEDIVFTSDTKAFRLNMTNLLVENRVEVSEELLNLLKSPIPNNIFSDSFDASNSTNLSAHSVVSGGWSVQNDAGSSYAIAGNTLQKNDNSLASFSPIPAPAITSSGSTVSFDVLNFGSGDITSYLRYVDSNNYYAAELSSDGYRLIRMLGGTESIIQDISETVSTPVRFTFSAIGTNISLQLGGIEKENIVISGVDSVGTPRTYMESAGSSIDNYELSYK